MRNIKKYHIFISESSNYRGTIAQDSIENIIDEWEDKPFNDYEVEGNKIHINTQESGDTMEKYKKLKSYLEDNFGIDSNIKDFGWKVKSIALKFDPNQLID